MFTSIIAATAIFAASTLADSVGSAVVLNKCTYDVHLSNVPASDGGFETVNQVLSPSDSYTQQWTQLGADGGWSIKMSKTDSFGDNILQYEYSFFNDGIIWYDLSAVNGNPWDSDWEVSADGDSQCTPRQAAYRYATDDAYGMQSCNSDATITVVLCSGEDQADGVAASISSSGAAAAPTSSSEATTSSEAITSSEATTSSEAATTSEAVTTTSEASASTEAAMTYSTQNNQVSVTDSMVAVTSTSVQPTTFATLTTTKGPNNVQTVVETDVVTQVFTTTYHHRHGHNGRRV